MRLMAEERIESEGRFGSKRPRFEARAMGAAYGGMVLERLARHTCRIAGVDWACMFVLDREDPRLVIAAAGCGVDWDLIGSRVGTDEGVVGKVISSGEPGLLADHRSLVPRLWRCRCRPRDSLRDRCLVTGGAGRRRSPLPRR